MPNTEILLNAGAQHAFVTNEYLHSAYMGGRGSGKTFAAVVRGLMYAQQPKVPGEAAPVGCLLADSFPHLKDIVYPAMYKVLEMAGIRYREVKNQSDRKFVLLDTGAEVLMRSLDDPNRIRGLNLAWFGIDEGRMFDSDYAYTTLADCLRQGVHPDKAIDELGLWIPGENYKHAGWVTSTPHGYDWQYRLFHEKSARRLDESALFMAPLFENERHLPAKFIKDITSRHEGLMYEQEVMGRFVGAISGAVWPMFDPEKHIQPIRYDPSLPLYAGWDFGIGDAGVIIFVQVAWGQKKLYDGSTIDVPQLRVLDCIEKTDLTIKEWALEYYRWLDQNTEGKTPYGMWGDPAGIQRQSISGKSVYAALQDEGVHVNSAPKRPVDEGIIIVQNLMERPGGFVMSDVNEKMAQNVQTYHWIVDDEGVRQGSLPVHDKTSHTCSALRYVVLGAIGLHSRRSLAPTEQAQRGTMGYIMQQLREQDTGEILMNDERPPARIDWHQDEPLGLEGLLD